MKQINYEDVAPALADLEEKVDCILDGVVANNMDKDVLIGRLEEISHILFSLNS